MEQFLRNHEHVIKFFGAMAAAIFAIIQYYEHIEEKRVQETLEFYKRFSSEPLYSSRIEVLKQWEIMWSNIRQLPAAKTPDEIKEIRAQWKELVVKSVTNDVQLTAKINALFDFFGALQVCIENKICDEKSAHELFQGTVKEFFENNCPYVAYMRYDRGSTQFGSKASLLAGNTCEVEIFKVSINP